MGSLHLRRSAVGFVALVVAFVGAGCEEEDPSDPGSSATRSSESAPTSPSEPTTTDTGPVEPTLPREAEAETKAGAEAFVEYYWDVVSYARSTGDVSGLRALSVESCAGCSGGINSIENVYDRGGRILGGRFEVLNSTTDRTPSGTWSVSARVKVHRSKTVGAGDLNQKVRPGEIDVLVGLEYTHGEWLANFLDTA